MKKAKSSSGGRASSLANLSGAVVLGPRHFMLPAIVSVLVGVVLVAFIRNREEKPPDVPNDFAVDGRIQPDRQTSQLHGVESADSTNTDIGKTQHEVSARFNAALPEIKTRRLRQIGAAERTVENLSNDLAAWQTERSRLMTNDRGRAIAESTDKFETFATLDGSPFPDREEFGRWRSELKNARAALAKARDSSNGAVLKAPDEYDLTVAEIEQNAQDSLQRLSVLRNRVNRTTVDGPKTGRTLEEALREHNEQQQRELEQAILAEVRHVDEQYKEKMKQVAVEARRKLKQQEIEHQQLRSEEELNQAAARERAKRQAIADETEALIQEEEHRRQEAERARQLAARRAEMEKQLPLIRQYLAHCITPGNRQLNGSKWVFVDEKVPLSLSGIRAWGALADTPTGYERMYWIGGGDQNDRPDGVFEYYFGGAIYDKEVPKVRTAQRLLTDFGDLLVAEGMLSP